MAKFRTIVADPPWQTRAGPVSLHAAADGYRRQAAPGLPSRSLVYTTLTVDQISALPVTSVAADDAHLYLWTINAYVEDAYRVVRAWGFTPSTLLVWAKAPKGRGLAGTFATATEYVLFARRGSLKAAIRVDRNWWQWKRGAHSAKPEAFQDMIEQISPGPYLELFARRQRLGWSVWGNEVESDVEMAS
jgi:N6-adenosine-specific RNA methylase IME4